MKWTKIITAFGLGLLIGLLIPFFFLNNEHSLSISSVKQGVFVVVVPIGDNDKKQILVIQDKSLILPDNINVVYAYDNMAYIVDINGEISKIKIVNSIVTKENVKDVPSGASILMKTS